MANRTTGLEQSIRPAQDWPLLIVLGALLAILIPSWNLGFVCEDYCHLVEENVRLPLISSLDGLHRPLRNALFKVGYAVFGLNSAPYHIAIIFLHLAAVALLYRFVLRIGSSRIAALTAAVLFGFFPRNHQAVFWVSVGVDSVVAICAFTACSAFLSYLDRGRASSYLIALSSLVLGLGFKETAIAIIPLLVLVHVTCSTERSGLSFRRAGLAYLTFGIVGAAYVLWVAGYFGRGDVPQQFYGVQSASQTIKMALKFILNMALPLSAPLEVRELPRNTAAFAALLIILFAGTIAALTLVSRKGILFTVGWILIGMAPTVAFGFYNDRYLSLPFIGAAILLGFMVEAFISRARYKATAQTVILIGLGLYAVVSIERLSHYERSWREATAEIRTTMDEARRIYPHVPNRSVFSFVNLTHSREAGQIYIFNVGLNGALWAWGYDTSITGQRTFATADPREQRLVQQLLTCESEPQPSPTHQYVLVVAAGVKDASGACAQQVVEASQKNEPELWQ